MEKDNIEKLLDMWIEANSFLYRQFIADKKGFGDYVKSKLVINSDAALVALFLHYGEELITIIEERMVSNG